MKTLLLTGCAGFIGSNFVPYFLEKYSDVRLINLDLLTYAGDLNNLTDVNDVSRHIFVQGDICDRPLVESLFSQYDIRGVIHFAAESHVDNSIKNPGVFIQTNINGSFTLIDVAYKAGVDGKNIRDWLYVLDHCKGIDLVYHTGRSGEVYNIGGRNERNNNQIAQRICTLLDTLKPKFDGTSYQSLITYV